MPDFVPDFSQPGPAMNLDVGVALLSTERPPALTDPQRPTPSLADQDKVAGSPKDRGEAGIFGHTMDPSSVWGEPWGSDVGLRAELPFTPSVSTVISRHASQMVEGPQEPRNPQCLQGPGAIEEREGEVSERRQQQKKKKKRRIRDDMYDTGDGHSSLETQSDRTAPVDSARRNPLRRDGGWEHEEGNRSATRVKKGKNRKKIPEEWALPLESQLQVLAAEQTAFPLAPEDLPNLKEQLLSSTEASSFTHGLDEYPTPSLPPSLAEDLLCLTGGVSSPPPFALHPKGTPPPMSPPANASPDRDTALFPLEVSDSFSLDTARDSLSLDLDLLTGGMFTSSLPEVAPQTPNSKPGSTEESQNDLADQGPLKTISVAEWLEMEAPTLPKETPASYSDVPMGKVAPPPDTTKDLSFTPPEELDHKPSPIRGEPVPIPGPPRARTTSPDLIPLSSPGQIPMASPKAQDESRSPGQKLPKKSGPTKDHSSPPRFKRSPPHSPPAFTPSSPRSGLNPAAPPFVPRLPDAPVPTVTLGKEIKKRIEHAKQEEKTENTSKQETVEKTEASQKSEKLESVEKNGNVDEGEKTEKNSGKLEGEQKGEAASLGKKADSVKVKSTVETAERVEELDKIEILEKKENVPHKMENNKVDKTEKVEMEDKVEKTEMVEKEDKVEKMEKVENKLEMMEKMDNVYETDKVVKEDKIERVEKEKFDKVEKIDKVEDNVKPEKMDKLDKGGEVGKTEKVEKEDKLEKTGKVEEDKAEKLEELKVDKEEKTEKVEKEDKLEKTGKVEEDKVEKAGEVEMKKMDKEEVKDKTEKTESDKAVDKEDRAVKIPELNGQLEKTDKEDDKSGKSGAMDKKETAEKTDSTEQAEKKEESREKGKAPAGNKATRGVKSPSTNGIGAVLKKDLTTPDKKIKPAVGPGKVSPPKPRTNLRSTGTSSAPTYKRPPPSPTSSSMAPSRKSPLPKTPAPHTAGKRPVSAASRTPTATSQEKKLKEEKRPLVPKDNSVPKTNSSTTTSAKPARTPRVSPSTTRSPTGPLAPRRSSATKAENETGEVRKPSSLKSTPADSRLKSAPNRNSTSGRPIRSPTTAPAPTLPERKPPVPRAPRSSAASTTAKAAPRLSPAPNAVAAPDVRKARSKVGSTENAKHQPGGGKVQIVNKKLDFSHVTSRCGSKDNIKHVPGGGNVQILSKKPDLSKVTSKCGSKTNIKHKPGGGDMKLEALTVQDKAQAKAGSTDNAEGMLEAVTQDVAPSSGAPVAVDRAQENGLKKETTSGGEGFRGPLGLDSRIPETSV
ncbi:microtubule-associated protein 4 isoform X5 [Brienomyrus brachyistius]|nr:microtubule-associated protein 4 isoform X5 [Brienomyrus brachyistius]